MTHPRPLDGAKLKPLADACYDRCYVYINAQHYHLDRFARSGQAVMDERRHKAVRENLGKCSRPGRNSWKRWKGRHHDPPAD